MTETGDPMENKTRALGTQVECPRCNMRFTPPEESRAKTLVVNALTALVMIALALVVVVLPVVLIYRAVL